MGFARETNNVGYEKSASGPDLTVEPEMPSLINAIFSELIILRSSRTSFREFFMKIKYSTGSGEETTTAANVKVQNPPTHVDNLVSVLECLKKENGYLHEILDDFSRTV